MKLLSFLQDVRPDHRGRYLSDIWKFTDEQIESTHDVIQWIFPLDVPSGAQPDAPVLDAAEISLIHKSAPATMNLERSTEWFLGFLARSPQWRVPYDHNHLRITRMIRSNRLLLGELAAESARAQVLQLLQKSGSKVSETSMGFWMRA
jgi:hypothetical protein